MGAAGGGWIAGERERERQKRENRGRGRGETNDRRWLVGSVAEAAVGRSASTQWEEPGGGWRSQLDEGEQAEECGKRGSPFCVQNQKKK